MTGADRILDQTLLQQTAGTIEAVQLPSGMIPWFVGGHSDPWNHVEAAMALAVAGRIGAAERAYEWLEVTQRPEGSWHNYYAYDESVEDGRLDTNVCAYVATGIWQHFLVTGDTAFVESMWQMLERAIDFVVSWQQPAGEIIWSIRDDGSPEEYALLTGSSSAYFSLRSAVACAELIGVERPDWELAAGRLRHAIAYRPDRFAPKHRFAMDWYYPVLTGALDKQRGSDRLDDRWSDMVMDGKGVRCVSDRPWVTAAETAECALALMTVDRHGEAELLLDWAQDQRGDDGSYSTGLVYPQRATFPDEERSTYTAAAMILAVDALNETSSGSGLFTHSTLPLGLDLEADAEALEDSA
jgi:hypothetical protein